MCVSEIGPAGGETSFPPGLIIAIAVAGLEGSEKERKKATRKKVDEKTEKSPRNA